MYGRQYQRNKCNKKNNRQLVVRARFLIYSHTPGGEKIHLINFVSAIAGLGRRT